MRVAFERSIGARRPATGSSVGAGSSVGRAAIALACALACALLASCGAASAERKAELERVAAARSEAAALEKELASASVDAERVERLRAILGIEVMRSGDLEPALKRYAKYESILKADAMSRIYSAVAQSMMAGRAKKIEDKLAWLRKGMTGFDELREEFPDDAMVPLYQASTYANFPREVGARDEVLDILDGMRDRYAKGDWRLGEAEARQVGYVYAILGRAWDDAESSAAIGASRSAFARDVPAFGRVLAAAAPAAAAGAAR